MEPGFFNTTLETSKSFTHGHCNLQMSDGMRAVGGKC